MDLIIQCLFALLGIGFVSPEVTYPVKKYAILQEVVDSRHDAKDAETVNPDSDDRYEVCSLSVHEPAEEAKECCENID